MGRYAGKSISRCKLKSATPQKTPTQNMKGREANTDDGRQGQHKRQAQIWTDTD